MPRSAERPRSAIPALAAEIERRLSAQPQAAVPALRALRREFSRRLRDAPPQAVIGLALRLCRKGPTAHRFVAYELVRFHPAAPRRLGARLVERLGRGIATWGEVDCFSVYVAGPAWRERRVPDSLIHGWARSGDRWWRRAALVSTVALNSRALGGSGDRGRTLRVCRLLERDRDPMVVKAMSWALRELAKRDPGAVQGHLDARRGALPALVLREVRHKLETGVKNPRRR